MTDAYKEKAREIMRGWEPLYSIDSTSAAPISSSIKFSNGREIETAIATALQEAADEALERAAVFADKHAEFCHKEAHNGGSHDLYERSRGATYIAVKTRALKSTQKGEGDD